ncbi:ubiquinol-cytochrome c reductase iron-sulfur subunit [Nitratireductor luteus]|uniref:ubiquinol-cytochrome c reductase iron-sulfur subunit n=1 Tax=Nitratireductor luteus TaxID=2976980 RepID=UPI0022400650|nr:ubiquinol-cytochrome c reductase iron-sulfur subunit [Nitratireductor luteus]
MSTEAETSRMPKPAPANRRDFLYISTGTAAAVGAAAAVWPLIDGMQPSADVGALATTEVDLSPIEPGQRVTIKWRSRPVFIVYRTEALIRQARADDDSPDLIDPAPDSARVQRPEWLVVIGVCTHLGCIPLGQQEGDPRGPHNGWFCPCHGSIYDSAGRVRKGPAPRNLDVPPYAFLDDNRIRIG